MTESYDVDPPMDTLMILIAELMRNGTLKEVNIANMVRRLEMSDLPEVAERIEQLHFSNEIDTPSGNRATIHLISDNSDGGIKPD